MIQLPWLDDDPTRPPRFPPPQQALAEPNGLLAAGGVLNPAWLLAAYRQGIFPWYSAGEPILWWSPHPRLVLRPAALKLSRSLRRVLRQQVFDVRFDTAFAEVIAACAAPRAGAHGTWITDEIRAAYQAMHALGHAHSVESWQDGELVGGLYGIALGRVFFGESMFSRRSNASKVAFAHLVRYLEQRGFVLIDCQVRSDHLLSLGAEEIGREQFTALLAEHACEHACKHACDAPHPAGKEPGKWSSWSAASIDTVFDSSTSAT